MSINERVLYAAIAAVDNMARPFTQTRMDVIKRIKYSTEVVRLNDCIVALAGEALESPDHEDAYAIEAATFIRLLEENGLERFKEVLPKIKQIYESV